MNFLKNRRSIIRVFTGGGIGDVFLLTGALRAFRRQHPNEIIIVTCENKAHRAVLFNNPNIDLLGTGGLVNSVFLNFLKYLVESSLGEALGFRWTDFLPHYGRLHPCTRFERIHATRLIAEMMQVLVSDDELTPEIFLTDAEKAWGATRLKKLGKPLVALHIASSKVIKDWPFENWGQLMAQFGKCSFMQIGAADERKLAGAADFRGLSLRQSFSVLSCVNALVAVDSSIAHAGAALRIPSVVLFGPSSPEIWGYPSNENIYLRFECSPCVDLLLNNTCPFGNGCVRNISVDIVRSRLQKILRLAVGARSGKGVD